MAREKYQTEHVMLLEDLHGNIGDAGRLVQVSALFQWIPYREHISYDGELYQYVGAIDAVPYYKRVLRGE